MRCKLRKRNDIVCLGRAVNDVREIGKGIVAFDVRVHIAAEITNRWEALGVSLPCLAREIELTNDVVSCHGAGEVAVVGNVLSGCEPEVIAYGWVRVAEEVDGQTVAVGESVEVRHRGASDDALEALVLGDDDEHAV